MQYSLIDRRPCSSGLVKYCIDQRIAMLAYGVLAGGFLTDRWLHRPKPSQEVRLCITVHYTCYLLTQLILLTLVFG